MERQIKFRGKRIDNGEWVEGKVFEAHDSVWILPNKEYSSMGDKDTPNKLLSTIAEVVHPETVGQYTGLKDRNGKDVYEGDLCKRRNYSSTNLSDNVMQIGVIKYSANRACFVFVSGRHYSNLDATMGNDEGAFDERLTVIGNIHDTSELLN